MPTVLLVGCGKMGEALLAGWLASGIAPDDVVVSEPDPDSATSLRDRFSVAVVATAAEVSGGRHPDAVVFAVKPHAIPQVAAAYAGVIPATSVALSIAAGRTIASLEAVLGAAAPIVRAMPNTPAAIGRGVSVACANGSVTAEHRAICQRLLGAVGTVAWLEDEALIDAVTAVSGSGPAYIFYFAECLAAAGAAAGLPRELAERLARETVCGAGELLYQSTETASTLRRNVTSPGGTTAAALAVLMGEQGGGGGDGLASLVESAVAAATRRARELEA